MIDLTIIPSSAGIYIFKDKNKKVLYIGKAKNLKKRISSYFHKKEIHSFWKSAMIPQIHSAEYILVNNEKEALLLELNQIKKYKPKYNILLKDDKNYCFIKIPNTTYPRVEIVRSMLDKKSKYIGPFRSAHNVKELLKVISKFVHFCTCKNYLKNPCMRYHLKLCSCPAITKITPEEYKNNIKMLEDILNGNTSHIIEVLENKMEIASQKLDFEEAIKYRENITFLEEISSEQSVVSNKNIDLYVINCAISLNYAIICTLIYDGGKLINKETFKIIFSPEYAKDDKNIEQNVIYAFLQQHLPDETSQIKNIILPNSIKADLPEVKKLIDTINANIKTEAPIKGIKSQYLKIAYLNAKQKVDEESLINIKNNLLNYEVVSKELSQIININKSIKRIECFDISHISGHHTVCGMSVFINGKPITRHYRKFNINSLNNGKIDDYASLKEALYRRLSYLYDKNPKKEKSFSNFPDIILIDGGIGQLSIIKEILMHYTDQKRYPVFLSIAKKDETIYMLNNTAIEDLKLSKDLKVNLFLQNIRDEAHRYSHSSSRTNKSKIINKSSLDEIRGIGIKKKKLLLQAFESIQNIKLASDDELLKVIGTKDLKQIKEFL